MNHRAEISGEQAGRHRHGRFDSIGDGRYVWGQIAAHYKGECLLIAVFDPPVSNTSRPESADLRRERLVLLATTFDAKILNGDWGVIGMYELDSDLPRPSYQVTVNHPDNVMVEDYSGEVFRAATSDEMDRLPRRKIVSPAVLELAVRAHHGAATWLPNFEPLRPPRSD